jgi:TnpA family transposase
VFDEEQWYVREETLREANTCIVNHHHSLELAGVFGGGTMSSSDVPGSRCAASR